MATGITTISSNPFLVITSQTLNTINRMSVRFL